MVENQQPNVLVGSSSDQTTIPIGGIDQVFYQQTNATLIGIGYIVMDTWLTTILSAGLDNAPRLRYNGHNNISRTRRWYSQ